MRRVSLIENTVSYQTLISQDWEAGVKLQEIYRYLLISKEEFSTMTSYL